MRPWSSSKCLLRNAQKTIKRSKFAWRIFEDKKNTEELLTQDVLKEKGGKGTHFEIPPADFLSDVDCAKKRRLAFLRNAREEMKSGSKYEKWCSSEFQLFDTPASKKCHQEKENVSCLVTGEESIKLVRERSSGDNIFDAERQVFSKNSDGTVKRSVIKETYARVTLRMLNVGCRL